MGTSWSILLCSLALYATLSLRVYCWQHACREPGSDGGNTGLMNCDVLVSEEKTLSLYGHSNCPTFIDEVKEIISQDWLTPFWAVKLHISLIMVTLTIYIDRSPICTVCVCVCIYIYTERERDGLCGLVVRVPGYRSRGPGFDFWEVVGLERGPLSLVSTTEKLLGRNSSGSGLETQEYGRGDPLRWSRDTLYP
jgi:hypothetical protein